MRLPSLPKRPVLAALIAVSALWPARSHGEERTWRELDRALAALEAQLGGAGAPAAGAPLAAPPSLSDAVAELGRNDAARQREFGAAAAMELPARATERLARAREAYVAGHGRLLEVLRELARAPSANDAAPDSGRRLTLVVEARRIVSRIARASESEPISSGELSLRAPALQAPPLGQATGVSAGEETPIGAVPDRLKAYAATLAGPVEIYEWVRNNVRPDFYYGLMKGPEQTFLEQSGNDADTAALLIALFRAKGVPARFVRATVELSPATLMALAGTASVEQAVRVLDRAGIPHQSVLGAGGIASVKVERIWAEAYLPYANYRGAVLDAQGKVWVPLDPGFKRLESPRGLDVVRELGFAPRETLDAYLSEAQTKTPLEFARDRVSALLADQRPGTAYADVLNRRAHLVETLGLLPSSLPYTVTATPEVSYDLADTLRHTVRFVGEAAGAVVLDVKLPVADLLGQRLTLGYVPATADDEALARTYGGLARTPPYLVEVKPVVRSGGVAVGTGTGAIGLGVRLTLRLELGTPGGTETVSNTVIAGNLTAIGLGGRRVTGAEAQQDQAAEILSRLAWAYLDHWNQSDEELSNLLRVAPVRPTVSACFVMSDVQVEYAGGDPLYPLTFDWRGIAIDADRRASAPVGLQGPAAEKAFLLLSGLEGSVLENRVFEDELAIASLSTAKGLGLAHAQGIEVVDLTAANVDDVLPGLPFEMGVKDDIREATARGLLARVPRAPVVYQTWRGAVYLLLDEETGEAAYQLQGGRSGAVTAPAVVNIPAELRDTLELQGEKPAPEGSEVTRLQKLGTTDFQEGIVAKPLARPFRVLVTNEDGFAVPRAPVTFTVIGGGGQLVDPVTGRSATGEVTVLSDDKGQAQVQLVLGTRTRTIRRFIQLEGDEFPTQVGLNLVSAHAGGATLLEPFTAIAFPDDQADANGQNRKAVLSLLSDPITDGLLNLKVAGRIAVQAHDPLLNPLSNIPVRFAFRGPPIQGTPPAGFSLYDGPTTTPGFVLTPTDWVACEARFVNPGWGECAGEAPFAVLNSSPEGAFAYAVVGDSTYSSYYFDIGSAASPDAFSVWFGTFGHLCHSASLADCADRDKPDMYIAAGTRGVLVNRNGFLTEAYPLGGEARAVFWADVVLEREVIRKTIDSGGNVHYRAFGTNQWRRERLTDSRFTVGPYTAGTGASGAATHIGNGNYEALMTMAGVPQLNIIRADGSHLPPDIPYLPDGDVDPRYVDDPTLTVTRIKDAARPWQGPAFFGVWGIDVGLDQVQPTPVLLGPSGVVSRTSEVGYHILPEPFRLLLEPTQLLFELKRDGQTVAGSHKLAETTTFTIPEGLALPSGNYTADLSVRAVRPNGEIISAQSLPVPVCKLLDLLTPKVDLPVTRDPLNETSCGQDGRLLFELCRASNVTLTVDGKVIEASVDGAEVPQRTENLRLSAGPHLISLPPGLAGGVLDARIPFEVAAEAVADPSLREVADGVALASVRNRAVLPVGHTFVKGVDLLDGHVVQQSTDLSVPGRHLGLEVTRTYSSAGRDPEGIMGAGWAMNYASLVAPGGCGLVTVITADGSGQVFRTADNGQTFTPQKGYHTRLVKNGDGTYDFIDKAGYRHHFRELVDPAGTSEARRLEYIEEPHGDRLVLTYDSARRVTKVAEVQQGAGEVRALRFTYAKAGGFDRLASASVPGLALEVTYRYDTFGNLVEANRTGTNLAGPAAAGWRKRYEYSSTDQRDRHQILAAVDPNGSRTEFGYLAKADPFPGESFALLRSAKEEFAKEVREFPTPGVTQFTRFAYDYSDAVPLVQFKTKVRDGRGNDTRYVLNGNGSPLRVEEPLGKTTVMEWSPTDIFKTRETDAVGRVTDYGYDPRGNLTSERISTADFGVVETRYEYDPAFNKLTLKQDAEGRSTRYEIGPKGDLLSMTDAVDNVTRYDYDDFGRLTLVTDPRGHATTYAEHDSFGNARTVTDPLGNATTRDFDARGRLFHETDTVGHDKTTVYDGLDRPTMVTRVAGGSSDPEVTQAEYFPGGEVRLATNPLGAATAFTLDGLNRVVKSSVVVGGQTLTTETAYDASGNKTSEKDRRGVVRRFTYDALNRLAKVEITSGLSGEGPAGQVAAFTYDLAGNKKTETDVAGLVTRFELDGLYRVRQKVLPELSLSGDPLTESYTYDRVGNRKSVTDANSKTTQFAYDGLNRLVRTENPLGHVATVTFLDPEGSKVNKSEDRDLTRGLRTTYRYDLLNREIERKVFLEGAGSSGEVYTTVTDFDDRAHTVTVTDARDTRTRTDLDGLDHPASVVVDVGGLALTTRISYDGLGNRKEVVDPRHFTTRFGYDELGRLVRTTDALSHDTTYAYDGEGLKVRETDRRGVRRDFTYDNLGRPRRTVLDPSITGVVWSHEAQYQDRARKRIEIDARSHSTAFDLDGLGRTVKVTDALGHTIVSRYDGVNKREETDKRGNTTKFDYDALNRLTRVTDPAPFAVQTVETTYLDAQNQQTEKDRRGTLKVTQTDPLGRVLTVTRAGILLETNAYDPLGNKVRALDGENKEARFAFDRANRLSARTDGFGSPEEATTTYQYDANGNRTEERDARAAALGEPFSVKNTYDPLNRIATVTDGESNVTTYGYDEEGNRTSLQEPEGQQTDYAYDELAKLLTVTQAPPAVGQPRPVTVHAYDATRNRIRQTDANGHVVEMTYDDLDRLATMKQDPAGFAFTTTHEYDENGNETLLTDPKGQKVRATYDELNRAKTRTYVGLPAELARQWRHTAAITYTYDPNSNLVQADESVTSGTDPPDTTLTTARTHDLLDRLASETSALPDGGTRTVGHTYFANGTRKTITDPAGTVTAYTYDGQNRLATATTGFGTPSAALTSYSYFPDDLLRTVTYPNGVVATHGYDKADRLRSLGNTHGPTVVSSYAYTYDRNGNRLSQIETNAGAPETTTYTYDGLNRLASVTYPVDASFPSGRVVTYGYDTVGNRTRETEKTSADAVLADKQGVFDNLNRLTTLNDLVTPPSSTAFTWDPNGNQLTKTVGAGTSAVTTEYRYDCRDKLIEVLQGASVPARFQYDFETRRSKKIGEEGIRQYIYDQTSTLLEYDEAGTQIAKYDYGSDRLIGLFRIDEGRRFFSFDGLRSVTNLTDGSGSAVASYHLDAWGNFRFPTELDSSRNRFGFTGYLFDRETNLFFAKARFYDPTVGRFTSQDSFVGSIDDPPSLHRYFYGNANPLRYVDPTGHETATAGCYSGGANCGSSQSVPLTKPEIAASDTAAWALGSVLRMGFETGKGVVELARLNADPAAQLRLAGKLIQKTPLMARAAMGDYLARGELLEPIVSARVEAYQRGVDEYADAQGSFARGWSATGTVFPEASIIAGLASGLVRGGARALAAVAEEPGASVASAEALNAAQNAQAAAARGAAAETAAAAERQAAAAAAQRLPRVAGASVDTPPTVETASSGARSAATSSGPGSAAHKATRWQEYQARGGEWSYERWSNIYEQNMGRAARANKAADAYHEGLGWGRREVTVDVEGVPRRLDIADEATFRGREVKTGYQSATEENLWEIQRDQILREKGWDIQWRLEGRASRQLREALERASIPYTGGTW